MAPWLSLAPLLVTLALRQVLELALRRGAPVAKPTAGKASIVLWYLAYVDYRRSSWDLVDL